MVSAFFTHSVSSATSQWVDTTRNGTQADVPRVTGSLNEAGLLAASVQFSWPPAFRLLAASVQVVMAADNLHAWPTRQSARSAVFTFIEGWYNRVRLHSTLMYSSPQMYEEDYYRLNNAA